MKEKSSFVYVTYIRTTPAALWKALTTPEFIRKFWFDMRFETSWEVGSPWRLVFADGRDRGSPGRDSRLRSAARKIALTWRNQWRPEFSAEGEARCIMELAPLEGMVKLTVTHSIAQPGSKLIEGVSGGWPQILSNLKSLLETGDPIAESR